MLSISREWFKTLTHGRIAALGDRECSRGRQKAVAHRAQCRTSNGPQSARHATHPIDCQFLRLGRNGNAALTLRSLRASANLPARRFSAQRLPPNTPPCRTNGIRSDQQIRPRTRGALLRQLPTIARELHFRVPRFAASTSRAPSRTPPGHANEHLQIGRAIGSRVGVFRSSCGPHRCWIRTCRALRSSGGACSLTSRWPATRLARRVGRRHAARARAPVRRPGGGCCARAPSELADRGSRPRGCPRARSPSRPAP